MCEKNGHVRFGAKDNWRKNDNRRRGAGGYCKSNFFHAPHGCFEWFVRMFRSMPEYALRYNYRVVHQHADSQHEPHHGKYV